MHFDPIASADGVMLGVSVIALVLTFQYIYLPTMVDGFRDRLFHARRQLLLLVAREKIKADDVVYTSMRETLNAFIRNAERVTFLRGMIVPVAMTYVLADESELKEYEVMKASREEAITRIPDAGVRDDLQQVEHAMAKAVAIHVVASSPLAWGALIVIVPLVLVGAAVAGSIGAIGVSTDRLVSEVSERAECEVALLDAA